MDTVRELYSRETLERLARKNRIRTAVTAALACAVLVVCVVLCAGIRTLNAEEMHKRIVAVSALGGWIVLALWLNAALAGRREEEHQRHMLDGERECDEGVVTVTEQLLRIPKSAPLLRAELRDGERIRRLSVSPKKAALLGPTPRRMRIWTVFGSIVAWAPCSGGDEPLPNPSAGAELGKRIRHALIRDRIRRGLSRMPVYILWLLFSVVLWSWIVGLRTDTASEKKVTLYLDVPAVEDAALSAALEEALPAGLKMVKARSFSYVLFQQDALRYTDLYVLPASEMAGFAGDLLALDVPAADGAWTLDGTVYGLRCYHAASGVGAAASYVRYLPADKAPEDYYICIYKDSPHIGDGAAMRIAMRFLELE